MTKVEMRIDGACSGNPGPGGWCAILTYKEHRRDLSGHVDDTTSQRMELMAAIEGLKALKRPCEATIYSDSEYVVKSVTEHQRHKENLDLWASLEDLLAKNRAAFTEATEGSGDLLFDECHKIARGRKEYNMATGTIKRPMTDRGFGFIQTAEGKDMFFHRNELQGVGVSDTLKWPHP